MRAKRNKVRKSIKYTYIAISLLAIILAGGYLYKAFCSNNINSDQKEVYAYTQQFKSDYIVNLLKNKYLSEPTQEMGKAYVTELIDDIDMNLEYNYSASKDSEIQYDYEIVGVLKGVYTKDGNEQKVLQKEYVLKGKVQNTTKGNCVNIKEKLQLDLKDVNKLVKDFEQELAMDLDAKYAVELRVNINAIAEQKTIKESYVSDIDIDIAEKTTEITGTLDDSKSANVLEEIQVKEKANSFLVLLSIIVLCGAIVVLKRTISLKTINTIRNDYRIELNRMLRVCQDKIVEVNSKLEINTENLIAVKDFGEIIKVSEELFKPILYWTSKEEEESWFCVMSNNVTYRYILKKN